jgi:DNA-binding MarR family transcriptional regulator
MLLIELTPAGRKVTDQYCPVVHHQQKEWPNVLTDEEQAQLIQMLHRARASLTASAP